MAKAKSHKRVRKGSLERLKEIVGKLQTSFSLSRGAKQGHFVVVATEGWEPQRFVIELGYLNNPEFLNLLKQAEEEFGFSHDGALAIPCRPDELLRILGRKKK
ncbi:hypothetical protein UlMin_005812 [Ulmus minor]